MCTDITELKRKELELELVHRRLRDYADSASDWFWETDAEHRFTYVSNRLTELTGLAVEDFIGRRRGDFSLPLSDQLADLGLASQTEIEEIEAVEVDRSVIVFDAQLRQDRSRLKQLAR